VDEDNAFIGDALALEVGDDEERRQLAKVQYLSSEREILGEQERAAHEIAEVLSLPAASATQLLRHFRWNKDRLLHAWVEDAQRVCRDAGVSQTNVAAARPNTASASAANGMCLVCADSVTDDSSFALNCGHVMCHGCWSNYLSLKISEGVTALTCPAVKCPASVDQVTVQRLVGPGDYARYLRFMSKTFVETNPNVRWCPAPGCGHAINVLDAVRDAVVCRCGFRFCFECHNEAHVPATCDQVKLWHKKGQDDSETTHWLLANTMECPKCKCTIEKNGGCNHMTCRQCRYEFCWLCRANWKGHNDYYSCNRFNKKAAEAAAAAEGEGSRKGKKNKESSREREAREKEESRVALEKYLHYYKRYTDHERSRRFETQVREDATRKMRDLQQTDATWVGVQFIARAAEQLIACRSVLKWSYVYAYYLDDGSPAKNLFEYLQKDLEQTTEELSAALSAPVELLQRVPVMNLTKVAERMADALSAAAEQQAMPLAPTPAPARAGSSRK
jgi:ariadne-1